MSNTSPVDADKLKGYLDYIDKEMTIMGILSTFCILVLGFVTEKLLFGATGSNYHFWETVNFLCVLGLVGLMLAALAFYKQRSLLAWYFGQISLFIGQDSKKKVDEFLEASDAWLNWRWYQAGFGFLVLAFLELGAVCLASVHPFVRLHEFGIGCWILGVCIATYSYVIIAYSMYPYNDSPMLSLWKKLLRSRGTPAQ